MAIQEGDHVAFVERGGEVVLRPIRKSLRDLRGSVPVNGPQDFDAVRASVRDDCARRLADNETPVARTATGDTPTDAN